MAQDVIKILVVEDDPVDFLYLKELLSDIDVKQFKFKHCSHLRQTIQFLGKNKTDIVLLDLNLPDSMGFITFEKLRAQFPQIPIILLTGQDSNILAIDAAKAGAQDFISKNDIECKLLVRSIHYAIERNRLLKQLKQAVSTEKEKAYHDDLTNLPNRTLFRDRLKQATAQALRYNHQIALLFVDLDDFKPINDRYGHKTGDLLLQQVSNRIKNCIRDSDTLARLGGDEFVVILDHISQTRNTIKAANKIIKEISKPFLIEENEILVTASIGISIFPDDTTEPEELLKYADLAMYRAKGKGSNLYTFHQDSPVTIVNNGSDIENMLRDALSKNEITVYYQPQINLTTHQIIGAEALIRWQHPRLGLVLPADFMAYAEESGLIVPLGKWVLNKACQQNKTWQDAGLPKIKMSVNLSPRQLLANQILRTIEDTIAETKLAPEYLTLEITETCAMQNTDFAIKALNIFREKGIKIAIDDFGTAYASLNYLKRFPINSIKIDRSFIKHLDKYNNDWTILSAIIDMAHGLKMKVLAEGVENKKQVGLLSELNCDEYQGFYKSHPVTAEHFTAILQNSVN